MSEHAISVGTLRQNPTEALRRIRDGEEYTITDRGVPIGRIVPVASRRWAQPEEMAELFRNSADPTWANELAVLRNEVVGEDPWHRH